MEKLELKVEALIFASAHALSPEDIKSSLESSGQNTLDLEEIKNKIDNLILKYEENSFSFQLKEIGGGYKFLTKPEYHNLVLSHLKHEAKTRLTKAAIETLSIIAYKQPVTRTEVESIRGVNCEYTLHKLLDKDLVEITGRDPGPGRPLIYKTSEKFMDYFGISSLKDLPKIKEIESVENQIGEQAPFEEEASEGLINSEN